MWQKCGKTVAMTIIRDYGNLFVRNGMCDETTGNQRLRAEFKDKDMEAKLRRCIT